MQEHKATINENGRLVIPAEFRKALDIRPGDELLLRIDEDELRISNLRHALKRAVKMVKKYIKPGDSLTDSLIKERRAEASHE